MHWQRGIGTPQKMLDGSTIWDALIINITPEKSAEEFLITKEKRYRTLVENSADAVVIIDLEGKPKYVSPSIERVLGYTEAESIMLDLFEILHPEDIEATAKRMAESLENPGIPIPGHTGRIKHKDGSWRWVEATLTNMLHDPNIYGIVDNFRDITERIQYEELLRQLNSKFELLLQSTYEGLYGIDSKGKCTFINNAAASMLGYEPHECIGKNMHTLIHHTKRDGSVFPESECVLFEANKKGVRSNVEDDLFWKSDGTSIEISFSTNPILVGGELKGSVVTFLDITESKRAADELKKSKDSLQKILDQSLDIICTLNKDGQFEQVSAASQKIWGYAPDELIGRSYITMVHPYDVDLTIEIAKRLVTGIDFTNFENRYIRKDGSVVPMIWSARWDEASGLMYCVGKDTSVTKQSELEMKMLINNTEESFVLTDKNLKILSFNAQCEKLYRNYFGKQIKIDTPIVSYAKPKKREEVKALFQKVLEGETVNAEILLQSETGNPVDFSINYKPVLNDLNEIIGTFVTFIDITEKKKYIEKLQEDEDKLQTAQKIAQLGYWQINLADFSLYWSDEVYNIWGVDKETYAPSYENLLDSVHPDDRHYFDKEQAPSFEHGNEFEHRIILTDGTIKWIHERGKYKFDNAGNPVIFEGTAQDITERHLARENLLLSEARHRGIIESQTNYVIRTDLEGNYTFCNEKFRNDFSWVHESGQIIGENGLHSIMDYHHDRVREIVEKCFENLNQVFQVELDKPKSDGSIITTIWDFICLTDSKGLPSEIQCVGIDISARKIAEDALIESNKRYEYVSRATFDAIWDWDVKTDKIIWGEGFYAIFGYQTAGSDVEIDSWHSRIHPLEHERVFGGIKTALEGDAENWEDEYRYKKADGNFAYVLDRGIILRDSAGKATRMVGAMQDVTEKKKLQDLLKKSNNLARIGSWEAEIQKGTTYLSDIARKIYEVEDNSQFDFGSLLQFYKEGTSREKLTEVGTAAIRNGTPI
ncbi:MAG: PAS domain S-box protein [Saprospiraceae bacterium]|nr:PAS domain S-box protein [Saprospiraceae bacterium]